jgi:hypothetical protein
VDPPHKGKIFSFHRGHGKMDRSNGNTLIDIYPRGPALLEAPQLLQTCSASYILLINIRDGNTKAQCKDKAYLVIMDTKVSRIITNHYDNFTTLDSNMDILLKKIDIA